MAKEGPIAYKRAKNAPDKWGQISGAQKGAQKWVEVFLAVKGCPKSGRCGRHYLVNNGVSQESSRPMRDQINVRAKTADLNGAKCARVSRRQKHVVKCEKLLAQIFIKKCKTIVIV